MEWFTYLVYGIIPIILFWFFGYLIVQLILGLLLRFRIIPKGKRDYIPH